MKRLTPPPFLPVLFLAVALMGGAAAAAAEPNFATGILDRAQALAADVSTNRYRDAESVLMAGMQKIAYRADGTYTQWNEEYVKILTEEGRRGLLTLSSFFVIPYQRGPEDCQIALVEIIRPDGTAQAIDVEGQSRIMVDPSSMVDNIYNPNEKIIQVNVPGLQVGDVLHYVFFDRIVQPRMAKTWCDWIVLEGTRPIVRQIVEIEGPRELPLVSIALKDAVSNTVSFAQSEADGVVRYRWEARDVPRAFAEPNMPEMHTVVQRLLVSTCTDWEGVSRWYWNLSEPHYQPTPEIEAKVKELTQDLPDRAANLQALFRFVAQDIRYMGIIAESEAPGYEPHDVGDTFAARHGVCRDKAALLVVMLRLAGFDAYPTLIHSGPKKDTEVPQPYFNHAIVGVREGDGYLLMDPTDETTKELLPSYLDDRSYLVATPKGDPLRVSPVDPASQNLLRIDTSGYLGADGRLSAETTLAFDGVNDNAYRQYFAQIQPEERRRLLEGAVKAAVPNARVLEVDLAPASMLDVSTGLSARLVYEADDLLVRGDTLALLPLPVLGARLGMVNFILGQTGLRERRFPFRTEIPCGVSEHVTLALDAALNTPMALPANEPIDRDGVVWSQTVQQSGLTLEVNNTFMLKAVEYAPGPYHTLKDTLVQMERAQRKMPIYQVAAPAENHLAGDSDVLIESETADFEFTPAGVCRETRTVRKRVLTYAGKKRHGELSLRYNPAWDEVELVRGVVTAPDGRTSEISRAEINLMDASWVGSARRYPAERVLVASFPAVTIGSTIEYTYVFTRSHRPFFSVRESFRGVDAMHRKRVTLRVPRGTDPDIFRHQLDEAAVRESIFTRGEGAQDVYEWEANDVPGVKREDQVPPEWAWQPTVFVSMGRWRPYAQELDAVLRRAAAHQPQAEALARQLAQAHADPWERLRAIRDAVATRVRLGGPAFTDLPLTNCTPADQTLADGYGNQSDRAVLLYAMLRAADFRPTFVAASRRPALPAFRESLDVAAERDVFSDVLVRVQDPALELAEGRDVYMGDDDQYGAVGASGHAGMWAMTLPDGVIAPVLPARDERLWSEDVLWVAPNGDTRLTRRQLLYGGAFGAEHRRYEAMTPEERRRDFQETIAAISQAAVPEGDLVTDFSRYPGRVEFTVTLPGYAVRDDEFLYLALPQSLERVFNLRSDHRLTPYYLTERGNTCGRVTVHLPEGFAVVMRPDDQHLDNFAGTRLDAQVTVEPPDGEAGYLLVSQTDVWREPAVVSPQDYQKLVEWDRLLSHRRARTVVLKSTGP
ncbi:MAG: DUF3857 domain-containing protein [Lentisphaerae bacterium]|nr:DUF3857 domain-containing protein [Lentisphaerota bacterium]